MRSARGREYFKILLAPQILGWCLGLLPSLIWAGPPFITDDPEPVEYQHWELYVASQIAKDETSWSGTAPHLEVNYGAIPNLQVHLIAPVAFSTPLHGQTQYGNGDAEVGIKYRFFQETSALPQMGTFELAELPTGNQNLGLGNGVARYFIPIWLQKTIGKLSTYGGGGYWINPGEGQQNYWLLGWEAQYQVLGSLALGAEIVYTTPTTAEGEQETAFNLGAVFDISEQHHLLLSAGRPFQKSDSLQAYLAYQWTTGP